jgi:endonuclease/exonuclease/phosphatase (EEP) superfamily protein YafD
LKIFFIALALFTIGATTVKLVKHDAWWIRMFDFPQAQFTFLGFIAMAGLLVTSEWQHWYEFLLIAVMAGSIFYQLRIITPYTFFYPVQVRQALTDQADPNNFISLLVVNVCQYNKEYDKCINVVKTRDADIIIAVETDEKWQKLFSKELHEKYPYQCLKPIDNTYGMLLYSKLELKNAQIKYLIESDVPSIHTFIRLRSGKEIKLFCLHPQPPIPSESEQSTERDAELLLIGKEARDLDMPVIVAGDLNDVAWSGTTKLFQRISGLLDPRIGRGFFNTFHAKYPIFRWPLDHVFHSDHFMLIHLQRLGKTGSDHFPIFIQLHCHKGNKPLQETPEPEQQDVEESREKIEKAREEEYN